MPILHIKYVINYMKLDVSLLTSGGLYYRMASVGIICYVIKKVMVDLRKKRG